MPLYVVETIATFRHKYVVEAKTLEHAYDAVAMEEAGEFSQMFLGEQIMSGRLISRKQFTAMNQALNHYGDGTKYRPESGSPWIGEAAIHKVDYGTKTPQEG